MVVGDVFVVFCGVFVVFGVSDYSEMVCVMLVFCGQCGAILSYWPGFAL